MFPYVLIFANHLFLENDVYEHKFENITGSKKLKLTSNGMVSSWMWFLQRNDVNLRNEWSNYTNWPYRNQPGDVILAPTTMPTTINNVSTAGLVANNYGPFVHPVDGQNTGIYITGDFTTVNRKEILETMGILLNGDYRENMLTRGVFDYIDKYITVNFSAS